MTNNMNDDKFLVPGVGNPDNAMTNNTDADIRAEFVRMFIAAFGGPPSRSDFLLDEASFINASTIYEYRKNAIILFTEQTYKVGIEKGKRIENEKMIGLAESILTIYAPYGLSDAQIKVLAKSSVDDYMRSINTSKD